MCKRPLDTADPRRLREHLITECVTVPADPARCDNKYEMSRRLAALSAIYRVNDGVRVLERVRPVDDPSVDVMLPDGSGERHTVNQEASTMIADQFPQIH